MPRALLSVYNKTGIEELARGLVASGWSIISSGGTAKALVAANISVTDVADHIDHIAKVAGAGAVGLGGDLDGVDSTVAGLEDAAAYPKLFTELARRGWTQAALEKLASGNMMRVLKAAEAHAAQDHRRAAGIDDLRALRAQKILGVHDRRYGQAGKQQAGDARHRRLRTVPRDPDHNSRPLRPAMPAITALNEEAPHWAGLRGVMR